ncbi:MAG: asparagine synthase-related protein, partial [Bdellovibrionales bacterium]
MNSLGFDKPEQNTRVMVAMSGGVDSSVAAALLHEQGYDVVGVTMQLYDSGDATPTSKTCCAGQDIYDAKRVAQNSGFPHYVLNYESNFKQAVIDDFADSYIKGQTPIPCVRCNQTVKFRDLLKVAH